MAPSRRRPFFIFGCPRSGTSLLTRMLDAHPDIAVPYESHLYNRIYPFLQRHCDLTKPATREQVLRELLRTDPFTRWTPAPSLTDTLAAVSRPDFHGIVEGLLGAWTAQRGKTRWGEKTPPHTLCWRTILAGFPDLQVIHLVRDGRDVVLSHQAAPFGPKHAYQVAVRWGEYLDAAESARAALAPDAFLELRYENLLARPEPELRRVCAFLGEPFVPDMLTFYRADVRYPTDERNLNNLRGPVIAGNREKWRTQMSRRELRIFEALAGGHLSRYGYARALTDARLHRWEALSCRFLEHPPRRAVAMLRNREGHRTALQRLRFRLRVRWAS
jgi:hypothetical protein